MAALGRTRAHRGLGALVACATLALGCARSGAPAQAPDPGPSTAPSAEEPTPTTARNAPPTLPPPAEGEPAAVAGCPAGTPLPVTRSACPAALADVAQAVTQDARASDPALGALEACEQFPVGLVRALRAERWLACADQLVEPVVGSGATAPA